MVLMAKLTECSQLVMVVPKLLGVTAKTKPIMKMADKNSKRKGV